MIVVYVETLEDGSKIEHLEQLDASWLPYDKTLEIESLNQPIIPEVVTRRQFKIALAVLGYNEQTILNGIEQLPEPNRTIAKISYNEAGTFERNSQDLIFIAKTFLQLTDEQIDQIFITANTF